jgi:hypothetical protein
MLPNSERGKTRQVSQDIKAANAFKCDLGPDPATRQAQAHVTTIYPTSAIVPPQTTKSPALQPTTLNPYFPATHSSIVVHGLDPTQTLG